jgi:hypothetical protein
MLRSNTRTRKISASHRNLTKRLRAPAKGNGYLQVRARWALWSEGEATTPEIMQWTKGMKLHRGERLVPHDYRATHRALTSIGARRVSRASTRGRPWRWRLKEPI